MTDRQVRSSQPPLRVEHVQSSRSAPGETRLRLSGRWLTRDGTAELDEQLLVVQLEGRRHRFPADEDPRPSAELEPGQWSATFTVPAWAEPRHDGQAALWIGNSVVPVPAMHGRHVVPESPRAPEPPVAPEPPPPVAPEPSLAPEPLAPPAPQPLPREAEPPRAGPLAELLFKDTITALRAELDRRAAEAARMQAELAEVKSELASGTNAHDTLQATLGQLRTELGGLRDALADQRRLLSERATEVGELREQLSAANAGAEARAAELSAMRAELAAANVSREAAVSEAAGLRQEIGRVGSELAVTRERVTGQAGNLGEADRLLAEARALADDLRAGRVD